MQWQLTYMEWPSATFDIKIMWLLTFMLRSLMTSIGRSDFWGMTSMSDFVGHVIWVDFWLLQNFDFYVIFQVTEVKSPNFSKKVCFFYFCLFFSRFLVHSRANIDPLVLFAKSTKNHNMLQPFQYHTKKSIVIKNALKFHKHSKIDKFFESKLFFCVSKRRNCNEIKSKNIALLIFQVTI